MCDVVVIELQKMLCRIGDSSNIVTHPHLNSVSSMDSPSQNVYMNF